MIEFKVFFFFKHQLNLFLAYIVAFNIPYSVKNNTLTCKASDPIEFNFIISLIRFFKKDYPTIMDLASKEDASFIEEEQKPFTKKKKGVKHPLTELNVYMAPLIVVTNNPLNFNLRTEFTNFCTKAKPPKDSFLIMVVFLNFFYYYCLFSFINLKIFLAHLYKISFVLLKN